MQKFEGVERGREKHQLDRHQTKTKKENREKILRALIDGYPRELGVTELSRKGLEEETAYKHLDELVAENVVEEVVRLKTSVWRFKPEVAIRMVFACSAEQLVYCSGGPQEGFIRATCNAPNIPDTLVVRYGGTEMRLPNAESTSGPQVAEVKVMLQPGVERLEIQPASQGMEYCATDVVIFLGRIPPPSNVPPWHAFHPAKTWMSFSGKQ